MHSLSVSCVVTVCFEVPYFLTSLWVDINATRVRRIRPGHRLWQLGDGLQLMAKLDPSQLPVEVFLLPMGKLRFSMELHFRSWLCYDTCFYLLVYLGCDLWNYSNANRVLPKEVIHCFDLFSLVLFKFEFYPVIGSWPAQRAYWSCPRLCLVPGLEVKRTRWIPWSFLALLTCFLTLYCCFSIRNISEAIFSFPDNLSRNIKDSLTTVNLQLILEWHSDVSQYSFILTWINILLCSSSS